MLCSCLFKWQREQLSNGISAGTCTTCRKEYHLPLAHWKAVYDEQSAFQIYSNAADARKLRRPVKTAAAHQQPAPVPAAPAQQRVADATHLALCRELACRAALAAGRLVCMHSPARQVLSVGLLLLVLETRRDV